MTKGEVYFLICENKKCCIKAGGFLFGLLSDKFDIHWEVYLQVIIFRLNRRANWCASQPDHFQQRDQELDGQPAAARATRIGPEPPVGES